MWHLLRRGKVLTEFWCGNVRLRDILGRPRCRWENNNKKMEGRKMDLSG